MDIFSRGRQHYVTEAKELQKLSRRPSTMEDQDKGGQGLFWAAEPFMMMMMMMMCYFKHRVVFDAMAAVYHIKSLEYIYTKCAYSR
jgi:hypothetical protein